MVLDFYGLREHPFGAMPDPRFTYLGKSYREALASICIGLQSGHGLLALVAPPGCGKTMVLLHLLDHFKHTARAVFLPHPPSDRRDLLIQIIGQLGGSHDGRDVASMHGALFGILQQERQLGRRVLLLVDEAHNLDRPSLETVRLLSDCETSTQKLLQIVIAGEPELAERLLDPDLATLARRISTFARIGPLTESETLAYIRHRLSIGGEREVPVFDEDALALVAHATSGVPLEINTILSDALHLGYSVGARPIGRWVVEEALDARNRQPPGHTEANSAITPPRPVPPLAGGLMDTRAGLAPLRRRRPEVYHDKEILPFVRSLLLAPRSGDSPRSLLFAAVDASARSASVCVRVARALASFDAGTVCIVDTNPSSPSTSPPARTQEPGVADMLHLGSRRFMTLEVEPGLWFLPARHTSIDMSGMTPDRAQAVAGQPESFDWLLADIGRIGYVGRAPAMARSADGVVLVVTANATRRDAALKAKQELVAAGGRLLGTVLTDRTFPIPEAIYRRL